MFKKIISMATATLVLAGGLSVIAAPMASATTTTIVINCQDTSGLTGNGWENASMGQRFVQMSGKQKTVVATPGDTIEIVGTGCGYGSAATSVNASVANSLSLAVTPTAGGHALGLSSSAWSDGMPANVETVTVTVGSTVGTMSLSSHINYVLFNGASNPSSGSPVVVVFTDPTTAADARLSSVNISDGTMFAPSLTPTFSSGTTSYSASTTASSVTMSGNTAQFGLPIATSCNGTLLGSPQGSCALSLGSNTIILTVTAADGVTTSSYTFNVTRNAPTAPVIATTSTIAEGTVNPSVTVTSTGFLSAMTSDWTFNMGTTGLTVNSTNTQVQGRIVLGLRGTARGGDITIQGKTTAFFPTASLASNTLTITVPGSQQNNNSSSSSSSDNSTAAAAAAEAKRQAEVAVAKSELVSTLKAGGPITAASLNAADIAVASAKAADRVIAKVAALPEAKRTDLAAIAAIVKTENFVDKVSTPATQITVTTRDLVIQELLTADYKYKTSIVKAILSKEASSLDTIEKIQAVVKAELAAIDARKARIAAVQARVLTYSKK